MRQEGKGEWHCPSCVGQCCCAACQRKETSTPSPGQGEGDKGKDSPPVISLAPSSLKKEPSSATIHPHFDLDAELSRASDKRLVRSRSSPPYPLHLTLSGTSSSPAYFQHQPLPPLEPLSSPISPDSVAHSIAHSSPAFSAVDPPSIDWDPPHASHHPLHKTGPLPHHLLTRPPHVNVRPIMPPNSVLAAINSGSASAPADSYLPSFAGYGGVGREGGGMTPPFFAADDGGSRRGSGTAGDAMRRQWGGYDGREEKGGSMQSHGGQAGGGGDADYSLLTDSFLSLPSLTTSPVSTGLGGVWAYTDEMQVSGSSMHQMGALVGELGGEGGLGLGREDGQQSMFGGVKGEGLLRHGRSAVDHDLFAP